MANICETSISVVGLKESPETFVKALSKAMFDIDLDNMEVEQWGCKKRDGGKFYDEEGCYCAERPGFHTHQHEVDPKTWYARLVEKQDIRFCVLYPREFVKCGVSVPRFYVETKWQAPYKNVMKASAAFPDLLFHAHHFLEQDGPSGEFVLQGGKLLEHIESGESWYLFDKIKFPSMSLLPKYMTLTLAQRGAAAVDDATELIKGLQYIIHHPAFVESRYSPWRDQSKTEQTRETLDALLAHMEEAAKSLTFDGVFLPHMDCSETNMTPDKEKTAMQRMGVEDVQP